MSRARYGLSGLVDSDSEDEQFVARDSFPTPDSAAESKAPAKRGRPKAKATMPTKATNAKAPARRISGRLNAKVKDLEPAKGKTAKPSASAAVKGKRKVLADKTNQQDANETEEVDEFAGDEDTVMVDDLEASIVVAVKQPKHKATTKKAVKATAGRPKQAKRNIKDHEPVEDGLEIPATQMETQTTKKKAPGKRKVPPPEQIIQETQVQENMDVDDGGDEEQVVEDTISRIAPNVRRPRSPSRIRPAPPPQRRAGSGSDTERSDPALRRKLGDMTKKYENLNVKYQDLREIGIKEAERNFEKLKKQGEDKTIGKQSRISFFEIILICLAAYDKVIASLKVDVASQTALAKESRGLKKKVESQTAEMAALKAQLAQMTVSLSDAHAENKKTQTELKKAQGEIKKAEAENKTLSTKLAANRNISASVESANTRTPGSAMKGNAGIRMIGSAEAALVAQAAQLKEDLYSDLTGLIVRSVKREAEDDVFDCIQTGRNGSKLAFFHSFIRPFTDKIALHFKLAVANDKSAETYDEAQCQYVPQLDPSRDEALIELLPDYLIEEITFPRPQAARFYARVGKALTEKVD